MTKRDEKLSPLEIIFIILVMGLLLTGLILLTISLKLRFFG